MPDNEKNQATVSEMIELPDGSGAFTASWPLPKDHWLYEKGISEPPMGLKLGTGHPLRKVFRQHIVNAARYAIRAATVNGKEQDFDPDALVQNMVIGLLGYETPDGSSSLHGGFVDKSAEAERASGKPLDVDEAKATMNLACARAAHEVNRAYCMALGDQSQPSWNDAPEWQRESALAGIQYALSGSSPEQMHEHWCEHKLRDGWKYGPVKDPEKKEHPCLVPYDRLPRDQQNKDYLFRNTVISMAAAILGVLGE